MIQYYLYKFGQFCVRRLPVQLAYHIASFVSDLHYCFSAKDRRAVKNNLKIIFPDRKNISYLAREVFRNFGKYLVDFFRMPGRLDESYIKRNIKIENMQHLTEALSRGRGVILFTAHLGNWELGGFVVSKMGFPLIAVALPHKERTVNNLFNEQRRREGMTVVPNNVGIRECIKGLEENKLIALLGDRDFNSNGEILDFFDKKAIIPKGPAVFSLKTGAPILPGFLIRQPGDTYLLRFEKPIVPTEGKDKEIEIRNIMRQCVSIIEEKIRMYPEQWFMFQRFWIS